MASKKSNLPRKADPQPDEQMFRLMFEKHSAIMLLIELETGAILDANRAAVEFYGYPKSKLCGMFIQEINTLAPEQVAVERQKAFNEERNYFIFPHKLANGEERTVEVHSSPIAFQNKHALFSVIHDITERKQAEEALRESQVMLNMVLDTVPQAIFWKDVESRYIGCNRVFAITAGLDEPAQVAGKTDYDLPWPPEEADAYRADDREVIQNNRSKRHIIEPLQQADGTRIWIDTSKIPLLDENGQPFGILGIYDDITERKQAEAALRESEALYRKMNENSPLGMHFYRLNADAQLIFSDANPAASRLLGIDHSQFIEKTIEEAFPPLAQTEVPQRYRDAAAKGTPWSTEQINYEDGRISGAFEVKAFQTTPGNMVAIFADITARKKAEEEILKLNAELEQHVRERTTQLEITIKELEAFSYSVSHDLRAPLRGIDGWSQALLEDYQDKLDEQGHLYIERVRSGIQHMGHLIDTMIELSRLTRAEMIKGPVDLSALAQNIVERLKQDEPQHQVDFTIQAGLTTKGDAHLLEIVLVNLLGNAFKFTAKRTNAQIEFGETELDGQRVFYVRDNGAGFDMAYAQKLFGAFQRMHHASEFPGTGVGLATVQRIIHRHGGRVWAEAKTECGATFYFTLDEN
jgi:PAS domain S-box-containing protein